MITILILVGIYLISVIGAYKFIQYKYKTDWKSIVPNLFDFNMIIIPLVNTFLTFLNLDRGNKIDWNKFFNRW